MTAVSAGANSFGRLLRWGIFEENANFTEFDNSLYFSAEVNTGGQVVGELKADGSSQVITLDSGFQSFARRPKRRLFAF